MRLPPLFHRCLVILSCGLAGPVLAGHGDALLRDDPSLMAKLGREGFGYEWRIDPAATAAIAAGVETGLEELNTRVASEVPDYAPSGGRVASFKPEWLRDAAHRFALIATVVRPDRDEVRLIYRLVETGGGMMPMTLNAIYPGATLAAVGRGERPMRRLEANVQLARLLDDGKDRFFDQTHYLMLSVENVGGSWRLETLENMPDVRRLRNDAALRARFVAWLREPETIAAVSRGTQRLPAEFAAKAATSVTPLGIHRLANAPYRAVLRRSDLEGLGLSANPAFGSAAGYVRRLDAESCVGCHQSRSVAGFHLLGDLRSPFADAIQSWRAAVLTESKAGRPPRLLPPDPERFDGFKGQGATCGLGDPAFRAWTCDVGLRCESSLMVDREAGPFGACAPQAGARDGGVCDRAEFTSGAEPVADRWRQLPPLSCPDSGVCATTRHGFPQGLCSAPCVASRAGAACLPVPTLGGFSTCLDGGRDFARCLRENSIVMTMPICGASRDCRPDFVCSGKICVPPYFIPALSVEHRR